MNIAQQDRVAQREYTCPRCGASPGKSWERPWQNPYGISYAASSHAERADLVRDEDDGSGS